MMVVRERQGVRRDARGQSTLEYLLVAVAILLAVLVGVRSVIQPKVTTNLDNAGKIMDKAGNELKTATNF